MTRLILILTVIFTLRAAIWAQTDSTVFLDSNTPVILRLAGNGQPTEAFFEGEAGQVITVVAQAADSDALDLVLEWVSPDGERLAYNDDWAGERTDLTPPDGFERLAPSDAALIRLILPETGVYTARINTFNGEGVGEASLTVRLEPVHTLVMGESVQIGLHRAEIAALTLELSAGQRVTLTAVDVRGRIDPVLEVINPDGVMGVANDDHDTADTALNVFDSGVTFTAETDGVYTVRVREFLGRAGQIILSVGSAP